MAIPFTRKQESLKTGEEMVEPELGAGTDQQDPNCVAEHEDNGGVVLRNEEEESLKSGYQARSGTKNITQKSDEQWNANMLCTAKKRTPLGASNIQILN